MCIRKPIIIVCAILLSLAIPAIIVHAASFGEIQTQIGSIARQIAALASWSAPATLSSSGTVCNGSLIGSDCTKAGGKYVCTGCPSDNADNCTALPCSCVCSPCANVGELVYMIAPAYEKQLHSCCAGLTAVMNAEYNGLTCDAPGNGTQRCVKYGDGICEKGQGENECNSLKDCPYSSPVCGNGRCETNETATNCAPDCGKTCDDLCKNQGYTYSYCNSYAITADTSLSLCKEGYVNIGPTKDCYVPSNLAGGGKACCCTKPDVVPPVCGNKFCEAGETEKNCATDCVIKPVCGNGFCEVGEMAAACPRDCGKTCDQTCKGQGYTYSYCISYALTAASAPSLQCKEGYANIGVTSDCYVSAASGGGKFCCCTKSCAPETAKCGQIGSTTSDEAASSRCCAGLTCKIGSDGITGNCVKDQACAKEGETVVSSGKKCCAGLVAQAPDGCLESEGCAADSWICKNKHMDIFAEINKIKEEIRSLMQRLQELLKELR